MCHHMHDVIQKRISLRLHEQTGNKMTRSLPLSKNEGLFYKDTIKDAVFTNSFRIIICVMQRSSCNYEEPRGDDQQPAEEKVVKDEFR